MDTYYNVKLLRKLISELNIHNFKYHVEDNPVISDTEFDMMFKEYKEEVAKVPEFIRGTFALEVPGSQLKEDLSQLRHPSRMLSLDNAFNETSLKTFVEGVNKKLDKNEVYLCEPKYDGLAVRVLYKAEFLTETARPTAILREAATRGDGNVGENVTNNIFKIGGILPGIRVSKPGILDVRGEVVMDKDNFITINKRRVEKGLSPYINPRNAAAGVLRRKSDDIDLKRLTFMAYDCKTDIYDLTRGSHYMELLSRLGFVTSINPDKPARAFGEVVDSPEACAEYALKLNKLRDGMKFGIDGAVVKLDRLKLREEVGEATRWPKWAIAYKFPAEEASTTLVDVRFQVGRTGAITPVGDITPTWVGDATVSKASLHNEDIIKRLRVRIGDTIMVRRAGDVVPQIVRVNVDKRPTDTREIVFPTQCPICSSPIVKVEGESAHRCTGHSICPAQLVGAVQHMASRKALYIDGLGDVVAEDLVAKGLVKSLPDLFKLTKADLLKLDGFAEVSANNLLNAISYSRSTTLPKFLYSLGIHCVGTRLSEKLAERFLSLDAIRAAKVTDFCTVDKVGGVIANGIVEYFKDIRNIEVINALLMCGLKWETLAPVDVTHSLKGKKVVVTGTLTRAPRDELTLLLKQCGVTVSGSVSKNTDWLVAGDNAGSKLAKAGDVGVTVITEDEIYAMMDKG